MNFQNFVKIAYGFMAIFVGSIIALAMLTGSRNDVHWMAFSVCLLLLELPAINIFLLNGDLDSTRGRRIGVFGLAGCIIFLSSYTILPETLIRIMAALGSFGAIAVLVWGLWFLNEKVLLYKLLKKK